MPSQQPNSSKAEFQELYKQTIGRKHTGLDFWADHRSEVLKPYRAFVDASVPNDIPAQGIFTGFSFLALYGLLGYEEGVIYTVDGWQRLGFSKSHILECVSAAFLHTGPRGMDTIAAALTDYAWIEPEGSPALPDGWAGDAEAFLSGLDFSSSVMSVEEIRALEAWYLRWLGEVPRYVRFLARHRPELLKAYRYRFEHCLVDVPKQFMPCSLLHYNVVRGFGQAIRENVLLCRGFGVTKSQALRTVFSALIYAGIEGLSIVDEVAGDVFDTWPEHTTPSTAD